MRHVYKGTFVFAPSAGTLNVLADGYCLVDDGIVRETSPSLPEAWQDLPLTDFGSRLVIPAFTDIHFHAVQYVNRGLGHDKTLLDWLDTYTFPEEARFLDETYADLVFRDVVHDLWAFGSLHSAIYVNISAKTTRNLMSRLEAAGLYAFVGKVNMDRFGGVLTEDTDESYEETLRFLEYEGDTVRPIITPRFSPSCTPELLNRLGALAASRDLPVQSHLNETKAEVAWVSELFPEARHYLDTYIQAGLVRPGWTIMAHCAYDTREELDLMRESRVMMAHCPSSNTNLASGVMPVRRYLAGGQRIGLGSDISGGDQLFMPRVVTEAVKASKLLAVLKGDPDDEIDEITAFFLATKGGGDFFGKTGSFEPGFAFDALVIDDSRLTRYRPLTPAERLTKWLYLGDPGDIAVRFLDGRELVEPA